MCCCRRHIHFRLSGGELDRLLADPEESPFVTNVRRGVLNVLRVSRPLLDTEGQVGTAGRGCFSRGGGDGGRKAEARLGNGTVDRG